MSGNRGFASPACRILPRFRANDPDGNSPTVFIATHAPGQETVARLDALGHVNKVLRGLRWDGTIVPAAGTALVADGKTVGTIASAAYSVGWKAPVGLAIVRVSHAQAGIALGTEAGPAIVKALPMMPCVADSD